MVVCALIVCMTTLTIASISFLHRFAVQIELEQLYMACRYMQRRAMCTHQEQYIHINETKGSYTFAGRQHQLSPQVIFGIMPGIKGSPSQTSQSISRPITFINNKIIFYPTGIVSSGTLYLTDRKKTCCYALSNGVSHISLIRRYRYHNGWHIM